MYYLTNIIIILFDTHFHLSQSSSHYPWSHHSFSNNPLFHQSHLTVSFNPTNHSINLQSQFTHIPTHSFHSYYHHRHNPHSTFTMSRHIHHQLTHPSKQLTNHHQILNHSSFSPWEWERINNDRLFEHNTTTSFMNVPVTQFQIHTFKKRRINHSMREYSFHIHS